MVASTRSHNGGGGGGGGGGALQRSTGTTTNGREERIEISYIHTPDRRISIVRGGTGVSP